MFCVRSQQNLVLLYTHKSDLMSSLPLKLEGTVLETEFVQGHIVAELQFAPRPSRFHALFTSHHTVNGGGRQAGRQGGRQAGRQEGRKSS